MLQYYMFCSCVFSPYWSYRIEEGRYRIMAEKHPYQEERLKNTISLHA